MKKIISLSIIALLLSTTFISCSKDVTTSSSTTTPTSTVVTQGTWKITYYNDSGADETTNYTGYTFAFTTGGSVSAILGSFVTNGTWTSYNDDSQNKLYLNFGSTVPLSKLKVDWHIIEKTSIKIRLEDVSGGGSGTDYLTLERL
ncbi:hypothetical protein [Ferruginibacter sp. SUN106]|uniref:hypothetical protein n=1 Tax=Ferruginibacter sp. SUN106 TaxID=2978348 RepID=UPI003D368838